MVGHLFSSRLAIELIIFLVPIQKCLFLFLKNTFHITSYRNRATEGTFKKKNVKAKHKKYKPRSLRRGIYLL